MLRVLIDYISSFNRLHAEIAALRRRKEGIFLCPLPGQYRWADLPWPRQLTPEMCQAIFPVWRTFYSQQVFNFDWYALSAATFNGFFDLAVHAEYFDQPSLQVSAQHLAHFRGPMTEDSEKGLYLLLEQTEYKGLGQGKAPPPGE